MRINSIASSSLREGLNNYLRSRAQNYPLFFFIVMLFAIATAYFFNLFGSGMALTLGIVSILSSYVFIDLLRLLRVFLPWLRFRLLRQGVIYSSLEDVSRLTKIALDPEVGEVFEVEDLVIYSDSIDRERLALIIFYLLSSSEDSKFNLIREALVRRYLRSYVASPLTDVEVFEGGYRARLEGAQVCFGTEDFLLQNGVVLDTTDIIGRRAEAVGFYLAIEREVFAAIEVTEASADLDSKLQDLVKFHKQIVQGSEDKQAPAQVSVSGSLKFSEGQSDSMSKAASQSAQRPNLYLYFNQSVSSFRDLEEQPSVIYNLDALSNLSLPFRLAQRINFLHFSLYLLFLIALIFVVIFVSKPLVPLVIVFVVALVSYGVLYKLYRELDRLVAV